MNETPDSPNPGELPPNISREDFMSALFANMVVQQTNMALIFLGKTAHPETGERVKDLEAAQMFIEQLEMLEAKTKGNLDKREEGLLKQSLMALRLAFVETVEQGDTGSAPAAEASPGQPAAGPAAGSEKKVVTEPGAAAEDAEARKKFSKKY